MKDFFSKYKVGIWAVVIVFSVLLIFFIIRLVFAINVVKTTVGDIYQVFQPKIPCAGLERS
jgi:hypothetical protein